MVINIMEGEVQAAIQGAPGSGKGTKKVFLKEGMFTYRPKNQLKLSEERQRIIKQYVHMPGVKTLSEPKEKPAGKGDWGMKWRSAFGGTGQGGPEEKGHQVDVGAVSKQLCIHGKLLLKINVSPCKPSFRKDITFGEKEKDQLDKQGKRGLTPPPATEKMVTWRDE